MLKIVKVQPTVGKADVIAVVIKDENSNEIHKMIQPYIKAVYGEYASIEYLAQFAVPAVDLSQFKVTGFIDADSLIQPEEEEDEIDFVVITDYIWHEMKDWEDLTKEDAITKAAEHFGVERSKLQEYIDENN